MFSSAVAIAAGTSLSGQAPREWRDYAGGPDSSRFVTSTQITKANVGRLEVAWTYPAALTDFNPLVVRGTVYARGEANSFVALDAETGKQLWIYNGAPGFNGRGVNYWESADGKDRRLIFSTSNLLQELDAVTGEPIASFGKGGTVDLRVGLDRDPEKINQQTRTPGRVFEDLIIMGSATNQEYESAPGDIRAFNVKTGALVWTFHTVPRPGEFGHDTWPKDAWKTVGGANNWGEQSIDVKRGIIYVPTAMAPTCLAIACSRSTSGPASAAGISRRCTTTSGISTTTPRHSSQPSVRTAAASTWSRWRARPAISTCSTGRAESRSGQSRNGRCRRTRRCRVRRCRRRSRYRRRRLLFRGRSSPSTI
jgi:glucose dehydrogenase